MTPPILSVHTAIINLIMEHLNFITMGVIFSPIQEYAPITVLVATTHYVIGFAVLTSIYIIIREAKHKKGRGQTLKSEEGATELVVLRIKDMTT